MAQVVTTSIVVQFSRDGSDGAAGLSAEIDSRPDGLNEGKTSFLPGDTAYFLVFKTGAAVIDSVESSAGSISSAGGGIFEVEETLIFANVTEVSLPKSYNSGGTYTWYGNNLGSIAFDGSKARIANKGIGVAKVRYNSAYTAYGINSPSTLAGATSFSIVAVVIGHDGNDDL